MNKKTYFTIVQDFEAQQFEIRQFRKIVQDNELLAAFHSFSPTMGVASQLIQTPLDYGFFIREQKNSDRHYRLNGRFDFKRLESALEFSFKTRNEIYDNINKRLHEAKKLTLKKTLYSLPFIYDVRHIHYQHYIDTIATLQKIVDTKPDFFGFHRYVKVQFADLSS